MYSFFRFLFFSCFITLFAQQGDYYLKHVQPQLPNIDNDNYTLAYDKYNRLFVGNRQGLIQYDGKNWNLITTPGTVFSLRYDTLNDCMFVGCMNAAGFIKRDQKGQFVFQAVTDSKTPVRNVSKVLITRDFVYFVSENMLVECSRYEKKITKVWKEAFSTAFLIGQELHIQKHDLSIWKWNGRLTATPFVLNEPVLFTLSLGAEDIIGTEKSNLYKHYSGHTTKISLQDSIYLGQGQLSDGLLLEKNSLLLSTVKGGCLLIQPYTGKTLAMFHLFSGLPDNEVYAIGKDLSGGAWIAHEYGLSRLDAYLPYRCYSNYLGLTGHVNNVQSFKNQLYVGTNEGIFILAPHTYTTSIVTSSKLSGKKGFSLKIKNEAIAEKTRQLRKRTVGKIFTRKKDKHESVEAPVVHRNTLKSQQRTTDNVARLSSYEFQKLSVPELKCEQLVPYDGELWAGTNRGIFLIRDKKATAICDENIRYLYGAENSKTLFASTTDGSVLAFTKNSTGDWKKLSLFDLVKQPISGMSEDFEGNLWLAGVDKLYKVKMSSYNIEDLEEFEVVNPFSDNIMLIRMNKRMYIYLSGQFFYHENGRLIPDPGMDERYAEHDQLVHRQSDLIWLAYRNRWKAVGEVVDNAPNLGFISLFPSVRNLYYDNEKKQTWIVTKDDEIFSLDLNRAITLVHRPVVLLSSIQDDKNGFIPQEQIELEHDANNLNFYFSSPDYYNQEHLEYQYRIEGMKDDWSNWSKDNSVFLHFINPGKYKLNVKVRNTFGQEAALSPIDFRISPPYWQTWWFYLFEVVIFAGLWLMTVQFSRKKLGNQVFIKLLTLLTLVMTVEFMSTVAENLISIQISPVIDFLVKVLIAITLLPIEKTLARVIRNKE